MKKTKINVVDAICGAGKTSWAIQKINDAEKVAGFGERPDKKYVYVTPFLNEVERVIKSTKADFFQPDPTKGNGSKLEHFKMMVELEKNIVTTHEIFKRLDADTLEMIEEAGYTLIMDETAQVIESLNDISEEDIDILLRLNAIEIDGLGKVTWVDENYGRSKNFRYLDIKIMADNGTLFVQENQAFYWTMNVKAFEVFDEVFILTYLFDSQEQKCYYDMHNVAYSKHSVQIIEDRYELVQYNPHLEPRQQIYELLNIHDGGLNHNFDHREEDANGKQLKQIKNHQLSSRWFQEKATKKDIEQLNKNLVNFFTNKCSVGVDELFWTTLSGMAPNLKNKKCKFNSKGNRYKDNFLPFNARATNNYADRTAVAYVYNRFMNPNDKKFFTSRGVAVNEDLLAVSDLIQFLFRGCIRKGESMSCYIPAERMRKLLKDWAEYKI
ncbi:hypothetical protein [Metabacillus halosaccharovorans]|uniref:hypothetical protein n=1 Tax=Metabacillus halosaccharovorans TaxID=930124 RepID=UPI0020A7D542|nr:hypothetical protein [Metabacillus halosaccharovorans]